MGFARDKVVYYQCKQNLELTAKWIDAQYAPLNLCKITGELTEMNRTNKISFEFDQATNSLKHLPLNGTAPAELRQRTEVGGPLAILDSYYGKVTTHAR